MSKSRFFTGQPVFNQLLRLIPKGLIEDLAKSHNSDYYCKHFTSYEHLVAMLFAVLQRCNSLREVTTGMQAWMDRLQHLGVKSYPKRSTLSDANKRRGCAFFEALYHKLIALHHPVLPDSRSKDIDSRIYLIDSTTIDLFNDIMGGAGVSKDNGRRKGGVKAHLMTSITHLIPQVVYLSAAKENDRIFMEKIKAVKGSILVFDMGYIKYSQWNEWTQQGIYWVSRLSSSAYYQVLEEHLVSEKQKQLGVISDQKILLGKGTGPGSEVIFARRVVYFDAQKQRNLVFVTNHEKFSASNIAALYKKRWNIETLFKSIKQNYQLRYFLGDNPNAIQIQIWCSLIVDLLVKTVKKIAKRNWSVSNLFSMIRIHLGTYVDLMNFLNNPEKSLCANTNQMQLFNDP